MCRSFYICRSFPTPPMKIEGVFAIIRIILLLVAIVLITLIIFHQTKVERFVTNKDSFLEVLASHDSIPMPGSNDGLITSGIILFSDHKI